MHRRRISVEGNMMRIEDAHAVPRYEPNLSIRRLRHQGLVSASCRVTPHAIRGAKKIGLDDSFRIDDPRVQFRLSDAHQAASHVEPYGVVVIFDGSDDLVAGQSILARKRRQMTVLNTTESVISGGPECSAGSKTKISDLPFGQPISGGGRRPDRAVCKIGNATSIKPEPQATLGRIGDYDFGPVL